MSSKTTKTITTNRIEIKDLNNKTKILLDAAGPPGYATVTLFADNGNSVALSVNPDGSAGISVFRSDGNGAAGLGIKANGESGLSLQDSLGRLKMLVTAPSVPAAKGVNLKKTSKSKTES